MQDAQTLGGEAKGNTIITLLLLVIFIAVWLLVTPQKIDPPKPSQGHVPNWLTDRLVDHLADLVSSQLHPQSQMRADQLTANLAFLFRQGYFNRFLDAENIDVKEVEILLGRLDETYRVILTYQGLEILSGPYGDDHKIAREEFFDFVAGEVEAYVQDLEDEEGEEIQ